MPTPENRTRDQQRKRARTIALTLALLTASGALLLAACGGNETVPSSAAPPVEPAPTLASSLAPTDYTEVGSDYAAARSALLDGDIQGVRASFSEQLRRELPAHELEAAIEGLRGDRVQFDGQIGSGAEETHVTFWGRLVDGTISGNLAIDRNLARFSLEQISPARPAAPLAGRWEGAVRLGEMELPIAVAFEGKGNDLSGTIDVPDEAVFEAQLNNVSFVSSVETGELQAESGLVLSPDAELYLSEHSWGPSTLVVTVVFDGSGAVVGLEEPSWRIPLPPDPLADFSSTTAYRLPFDGVWFVSSGGPTELETHHVAAPAQRHGYDLVIWNEGGAHRAAGTRNEDHWAWGAPVLAPASGTVVAVVDGISDNTPGGTNTEAHPAGNHVVLRTGSDEFLFLAHFQMGTIGVQEGDEVSTGTVLGLAGNSGNSFGPHVHIHLQDEADFHSRTARGLPLPFTGYFENGELHESGSPIRGDLVQHRGS